MNTREGKLFQLALMVALLAGCASASVDHGLSAEERDAARSAPGTGSAVHSLAGAEYVGAFTLDVTGETVSFYLSGYDSVARNSLGGRVLLPADFSRQQDGAFDFQVTGPADGTAGGVQVNSESAVGYQVESGSIRADDAGLLSVRLVVVRIADVDSEGFDVPGTGGTRETLSVSGHLTATCNVRLPSNDVVIDAEHTANPLCAELLRGL